MAKYDAWLTKEGVLKIEGWARDGLTEEQIAHNIGIKRQTLYEWKKRFSVISYALKRGKEVVDREVENALLKRALGYTYEEVTVERQRITEDNFQSVETRRVKRQVPPDTTALIFWLKNRKPEIWRDRKEIENSGNINHGVNIVIGIPDTEEESNE
ncbi:hypothetical protein CN581_14475 [Bacillus toyonensis]|uniref:hypothetical protein n=1 Tax=Bacillus toyonensis TaxID=155322 RepID=UPI000BF732CF|nr:hypothetical protein [Bacillus toyonensis]PEP80697.1 hypothetical protein CN581_14475 [Bacillus toyonensis]